MPVENVSFGRLQTAQQHVESLGRPYIKPKSWTWAPITKNSGNNKMSFGGFPSPIRQPQFTPAFGRGGSTPGRGRGGRGRRGEGRNSPNNQAPPTPAQVGRGNNQAPPRTVLGSKRLRNYRAPRPPISPFTPAGDRIPAPGVPPPGAPPPAPPPSQKIAHAQAKAPAARPKSASPRKPPTPRRLEEQFTKVVNVKFKNVQNKINSFNKKLKALNTKNTNTSRLKNLINSRTREILQAMEWSRKMHELSGMRGYSTNYYNRYGRALWRLPRANRNLGEYFSYMANGRPRYYRGIPSGYSHFNARYPHLIGIDPRYWTSLFNQRYLPPVPARVIRRRR